MSYLAIVLLDLVILVIGISLSDFWDRAALSFAVPAIGIVTFFGVLARSEEPNGPETIRRAIAISLVTVYLVLVGILAFYPGNSAWSELEKTLFGSFTATISVVIAFYFGSSAYIRGKEIDNK
jgi:uncharacterized membrane protein YidH (DUF202 family)